MPIPPAIEELRARLSDLVATASPASGRRWWREPLLAAAPADGRFLELKRIVSPDHALPGDLLSGAMAVVVYFIPFQPELLRANAGGTMAIHDWGLAYVETNALIGQVNAALADLFRQAGFAAAVTPATHNYDQERLMSAWSHKHLGHLTGLGRFGRNCQLITPAGCGGRLGSLVTTAPLRDAPLTSDEHDCLDRAGRPCLACAAKCPAGAISADGFDRFRCNAHLIENDHLLGDLPSTHVCGTCQAMVPCSLRNPVAERTGR